MNSAKDPVFAAAQRAHAPSTVASEAEADSLQRAVSAAYTEISALCHGKQWRMCIPVEPSDSDIVICAALRALESRIAALTAEREAGRALMQQCADTISDALPSNSTTRPEVVEAWAAVSLLRDDARSAAPPTPESQ